MNKFLNAPLLRNVAFAAAALLVAGTAATPALADGYHGRAGGHFDGGHFRGGFGGYGYGRGFDRPHWFGGYWGPRFYGPAYVYPPAAYVPGVNVWIR